MSREGLRFRRLLPYQSLVGSGPSNRSRTKPSVYFLGEGGTVGSADEVVVWAAARAGMRDTRKSENRILKILLSQRQSRECE